MTPIDPIDYLLVGHVTADLTPTGRVLGGTVAYAARTAFAFGLRVGVLTSAAPDEPLLDELRPYAHVVCVPADHTTTYENVYDDAGRRTQIVRAVAAPLLPGALPGAWYRSVPLVHLAPIAGELTLQSRVPAFPGAANARYLLTLQGLLRQWGADGRVTFREWYNDHALCSLDWLVFSEEDVAAAPAMEAVYATAPCNVVITRGAAGGTVVELGGHHWHYPTPQVNSRHPTGAGDVFAAALLCGLHPPNHDVWRAAHVAAVLAANATTRPGWEGAPSPDEVEASLALDFPRAPFC